jgi:hypothetical protein
VLPLLQAADHLMAIEKTQVGMEKEAKSHRGRDEKREIELLMEQNWQEELKICA